MNRIAVPADDAARLEDGFAASMRDTLSGVEGLAGSRLLRPSKKTGAYVSLMEFQSQADFTAWVKSEAFAAAHATTSEGMTNDIEIFETVEDVSGKPRRENGQA